MVSMKRKPSKSRGISEVAPAMSDEYPYGLEIRLDDECLKKLGMDAMPEIGATMTLTAKVKVTSMSQHSSEGGSDRSMGLQITEMELGTGAKKEKAGVLYG